MRRIAYIELDTHAEIAANFMELMTDSESFSVDYFFSEKISKEIGKKERITIIRPQELPRKLKDGNYDLVMVGTAHRYFNIFKKIVYDNSTAVIVHNVNFSTTSKWRLFFNIFKKDIIYRIKLLLKEGLLSMPEVYRKVKKHLVLDESMAGDGVFLPLFFTKFKSSKNDKIPKIVIPGAVTNHRRDYDMVLEQFPQFKNPFELILLGKVSGEEEYKLREVKKNLPEHLQIKWFTEKVSQSVFDEILSQADILWCPVKRETEFFSQQEIYGETKMSGNMGDAIKYGKLAIFPTHFNSREAYIIQQNDNVEVQILSLIYQNFYDFESQYNKEKVLKKLETVLFGLL